MSTFSERLRKSLIDSNLKQSQLAEMVGVKQQAISYLCSGKTSQTRHLNSIANALNVDPGWLMTGVAPKNTPKGVELNARSVVLAPLIPLDDLKKYRSIEEAIMAGGWKEDLIPRENLDEINEGNVITVPMNDNSMEPDIPKGISVVVSDYIKPRPGAKVVIKVGESLVIREYREAEEGYRLAPVNNIYAEKTIKGDQDLRKLYGVCIGTLKYERLEF